MAFILPTTGSSGSTAAVPSNQASDSGQTSFTDHLKRASQPAATSDAQRAGPRDTPRSNKASTDKAGADKPNTDKQATDKPSDASGGSASSDTSKDGPSTDDATSAQQPAADTQDDKADDQKPSTSDEAVVVAAVTVEQAAAPIVDEVTIESTTVTDTTKQGGDQGEQPADAAAATKAALQQAVGTTDVAANTPAPSGSGAATKEQHPAPGAVPLARPLPQFAPSNLQALEAAVKTKQQSAQQVVAEGKQAETSSKTQSAAAAQEVAVASAAPALVTIVSAHEAMNREAEAKPSSEKPKTEEAQAAPVVASLVAAAIQVPLPVDTASAPIDPSSNAVPQAKRVEPDADPTKPTDSMDKTQTPTGGVDATNSNRPQTSFAGHNLLRTDSGPNGTSEVDRVRFVQRVAKAFRAAEDQGGQIKLRLNPPELGAVKLEITMKAGVMTARLETETPAARSMLLDNLPALRERLAEQNVKVEKFDVDVMDRQSGGQPDATPDNSPRGSKSSKNFFGADKQEEAGEPVSMGGRIFVDSGQLNVVI